LGINDKTRAYAERIHRSGNFNEQAIDARHPPIGTGALRFFDC
jgi:hypothetical protein